MLENRFCLNVAPFASTVPLTGDLYQTATCTTPHLQSVNHVHIMIFSHIIISEDSYLFPYVYVYICLQFFHIYCHTFIFIFLIYQQCRCLQKKRRSAQDSLRISPPAMPPFSFCGFPIFFSYIFSHIFISIYVFEYKYIYKDLLFSIFPFTSVCVPDSLSFSPPAPPAMAAISQI